MFLLDTNVITSASARSNATYARRKGWRPEEAERWLAPVLKYDPAPGAREAAEYGVGRYPGAGNFAGTILRIACHEAIRIQPCDAVSGTRSEFPGPDGQGIPPTPAGIFSQWQETFGADWESLSY